jgi:hypothetical protein
MACFRELPIEPFSLSRKKAQEESYHIETVNEVLVENPLRVYMR